MSLRPARSVACHPIALLTLLIAAVGCQGNHKTTTAPPIDVAIEQLASEVATPASSALLGGYVLEIDESAGEPTFTLTQPRELSAAGEAYAVDVTGLFKSPTCADCFQVTKVKRFDPLTVQVSFQIKHPFALPPQPYGEKARLDLHVFDMMLHVLSDGHAAPHFFNGGNIQVADGTLLSPDGYTSQWDQALQSLIPTPNVTHHPFKLLFEDSGAGNFDRLNPNGFANLRAPTGHNVFPMGANKTTFLRIPFPANGQTLKIGLALTCSYGTASSGKGSALGQWQSPIYYLPEFNYRPAWRVKGAVLNSSLKAGFTNSTATLECRYRDWQIGANANGSWEFGVTGRDEITAIGHPKQAIFDVPGVAPRKIVTLPTTGDPLDENVVTTTISNSMNAPAGTYWGLMTIVDNQSMADFPNLDRKLSPFTNANWDTSQLFTVTVLPTSTNTSPTALLSPNPAMTSVCGGDCGGVDFNANQSTDLETPLANLMFEWDYDLPSGNPANFSPDGPASSSPMGQHDYCVAQNTYAAVRVIDADSGTAIAVVPVQFEDSPVQGWTMTTPATLLNTIAQGTWGDDLLVARNDTTTTPKTVVIEAATKPVGGWADPATWETRAGFQLESNSNSVSSMFVHPEGTIILSLRSVPIAGQQIWTSTNAGNDPWEMQASFPDLGSSGFRRLLLDPATPNTILAIGLNSTGTRMVQLRTTTGPNGTWTQSDITQLGDTRGLLYGNILAGGPGHRFYTLGWDTDFQIHVRRSDNGGATWAYQTAFDHDGNDMQDAFAPASDSTGRTLLLCFERRSGSGPFGSQEFRIGRSTDGGVTLSPITALNGSSSSNPSRINFGIIDGQAGKTYVLVMNYTYNESSETNGLNYLVYSTPDSGASWSPKINPGMSSFGLVSANALIRLECDYAWLEHGSGSSTKIKVF